MNKWLVAMVFFASLTPASARDVVDEIRQTHDALAAASAAREQSTEVPAAFSHLLAQLKAQILAVITAEITQAKSAADAGAVHDRVVATLSSAGMRLGEPLHTYAEYGELMDLKVRPLATRVQRVVVISTLSVPCGSDSSMYVFERRKNAWNLILKQEAADYDTVAGAQANIGYVVLDTGDPDAPLIMAADVNPWCSSCWQEIRYRVLRPSRDAARPEVLLSGHDGIYVCGIPSFSKELFHLASKDQEFHLTFASWGHDNIAAVCEVTLTYKRGTITVARSGDCPTPPNGQ